MNTKKTKNKTGRFLLFIRTSHTHTHTRAGQGEAVRRPDHVYTRSSYIISQSYHDSGPQARTVLGGYARGAVD
jgi:hypothetical protein